MASTALSDPRSAHFVAGTALSITGVALTDLGPTLINKLREVLSSSSEFIKHLSNKKVSHKFSTVYKLHVSR